MSDNRISNMYARVCSRMLTYADVLRRMETQLLALEEEEVIRDSDDEGDDEFVTGDVKEAMAQDRSRTILVP